MDYFEKYTKYTKRFMEGVSPSDLAKEKIIAISSDTVPVSPKDLLDLYQLVMKSKYTAIVFKGINVENFEMFKNHKDTLRIEYDNYSVDASIEKPSFDKVYDMLCDFLEPLWLGSEVVDKYIKDIYVFCSMWRRW